MRAARTAWIVIAALLCSLIAAAQSKPDFSGTWKADLSKSNFGPMPVPQSATLKVEHKEPSFKLVSTTVGDSGERTYEVTFTTDGKECTNFIGNTEVKSVLKWEGETLLMEHKTVGGEVVVKDRWTLSDGGQVLTLVRHWSGSQGELTQTLVHQKQ